MRKLNALIAIFLLGSPIVALAQDMAPAPSTTVDKKDPNRMVCRTVETTGSRLGSRKECHTAAQWTEIQAIERRDIEKYQATRYHGNN